MCEKFITVVAVLNNSRYAGRSRGANLSNALRVVLDAVIDRGEPVTVAGLAADLGLHPNTVRSHLDALTVIELISRESAPINGRGRPTWLYQPTLAAMRRDQGYAGLATALADQLERSSSRPRDEAISAGERWGHEVSEASMLASEVQNQVITLLDELGFDPEPGRVDGRVRLRSCPMIDAAQQHPDVVCGVHLGMVRGILRNAGGDPDTAELLAFYEPDACHLGLDAGGGG